MKILLILIFITSCSSKSWRDTSRESSGLAPKPSELKEDIFQIYYARAFSWRGTFGVHPWVAWKRTQDKSYTVAQVTSFNLRRSDSTISVREDIPDRLWFDNQPTMLLDVRGERASMIIKKLPELINNYPYSDRYQIWPGPNSNTFVSYLIRNIDEIKIELPPHAIGKDYYGSEDFFVLTPSKTGAQFSFYGILGLGVGLGEGVELNVLGLNFGLDLYPPALKLPFIGRAGFADKEL